LEDFLLRSRSGHCEYFATATVLLLRAAGLPARYATGYSVQEFSTLEHMYVARARHAHAWALVYINGAWHDFDTTPAAWFSIEERSAWFSEPLSDLWSRGVFLLSQWRWGGSEGSLTPQIGWLLIPLVALLVWRLAAGNRVRRTGTSRTPPALVRSYPGADSEFYRLEKRLQELGLARHPWEPLACWLPRITAAQPQTAWGEPLATIISLHYRYRFDPHGISPAERAALAAHVQAWFEQHQGM
ncbi:MAG: transglutaminase-like domain-containing protein, partial [Candidatus Entotheonellia bacterium]